MGLFQDLSDLIDALLPVDLLKYAASIFIQLNVAGSRAVKTFLCDHIEKSLIFHRHFHQTILQDLPFGDGDPWNLIQIIY